MSEVISRLKLESGEFDSKIKRAAQGIQRLAEECHNAGSVLNVLEEENRKYIQSIGQMETVNKTARGSVAELTAAFMDMKHVYNQLSDEEKNGEVGRELNKQLGILKQRINDGNQEIKNMQQELNGGGGLSEALNSIAGKFGLNISQLTKFGSILGVASGALKVAKDAFFENETNVDEWGRTVAAAEGVYDSFLQTLNNGDFSGFLSRISEVINKANEAYNALDELNTRMTIINPERTKLQARATELKATIRRQGADSAEGKAAQTELRQLEGQLSKAYKTESKLNYNAFKALVDARLKNAGISLDKKSYDFLMRTFSSDDSYMAMRRGAKGSNGREFIAGGSYDEGSTYKSDTRNINQKLLDLFTDEWRKENWALLNAAFGARGAAASVMLSNARYLKGGSGGGGGKSGGTTKSEVETVSGSIDEQAKKVQELQKAWRAAANDDSRQKIKKELGEAQAILDRMTGKETFDPSKMRQIQGTAITPSMEIKNPFEGIQNLKAEVGLELKEEQIKIDKNTLHTFLSETIQRGIDDLDPQMSILSEKIGKGINVPDEAWKNLQDELNEKLAEMGLNPIDIGLSTGNKGNGKKNPYLHEEDGKNTVKLNEVLGGLAGGMSQMVKGMESLGIELPEGINKAIGAIDGIASILTAIQAIITAIEAISAADALIPFARGGIVRAAGGYVVPGTRYSGDLVPAALSSGELVLNQAQQGNLASQLQGAGLSGMQLSAVISGEQIKMVLNNNSRRTGRGEYVTTKFN